MSEALSKLYLELGSILPTTVKTEREIDLETRIATLTDQVTSLQAELKALRDAVLAFRRADQSEAFLDIVEDSEGYIENAAQVNKARIERGDALKHMYALAAAKKEAGR